MDIYFTIIDCNFQYIFLVPVTPLSKVENVTTSLSTIQSDRSLVEHNGYTMSSSSHEAGSPPPESNGSGTSNMDKKNKKKMSLGGSFTKFWKGNKKVKDNGKDVFGDLILMVFYNDLRLLTCSSLLLLLSPLKYFSIVATGMGCIVMTVFPAWLEIPHCEVLKIQAH